jgi:hypothetical protein
MRWVRIVLICEKSRRYRDKVLGLVSFEVFSDEHSRLAILKLGTLPHFEVLPLHLHLISGVIPQEGPRTLLSYGFSPLFGYFKVRFLRLNMRWVAFLLG